MDNNGWNEGQNQYGQNPYGQNGNRNGSGNSPMGLTSMVLGIASLALVCGCYLMSIPLGIFAVVFGILSIKKCESQRGFAITGIITGIIGFVFSIALFILACYMVSSGIYDRILHEFHM